MICSHRYDFIFYFTWKTFQLGLTREVESPSFRFCNNSICAEDRHHIFFLTGKRLGTVTRFKVKGFPQTNSVLCISAVAGSLWSERLYFKPLETQSAILLFFELTSLSLPSLLSLTVLLKSFDSPFPPQTRRTFKVCSDNVTAAVHLFPILRN